MKTTEFQSVLELSEREFEVFTMLGQGLKCGAIARQPGHVSSTKTIESHCLHIKHKLNLASNESVRAFATRYLVLKDQLGLNRVPASKAKFAFTPVSVGAKGNSNGKGY